MEEKDIKLTQSMLIFLFPYETAPTTYKAAKKMT